MYLLFYIIFCVVCTIYLYSMTKNVLTFKRMLNSCEDSIFSKLCVHDDRLKYYVYHVYYVNI